MRYLRAFRVGVAAAAGVVSVLAVLAPGQAGAAGLGPSALGWFDATEQPGAPAVPQPDVPGGGGLIAGATTAAGTETTAVTAIRFDVPAGTSSTTLTLPLASSNAPGIAPLACLTTSSWSPGYQQAGAGPTYDCTHSSLPTTTGSSLVFSDIGQLQRGTILDVVLVPSAAGRIVLDPPPSTALTTIGVPATPQTPVFTAPVATSAPPAASAAPASSSSAASRTTPSPTRRPQPTPTPTPTPTRSRTPSPVATRAAATAAAPRPAPVQGSVAAATPTPVALLAAVPSTAAVVAPVTSPPAPTPTAVASSPAADPTLAAAVVSGQQPPAANLSAAAPLAASQPLQAHRLALTLALVSLLVLAAVLFLLDPDSRTGRVGAAVAVLRGAPAEAATTPSVRGIGRHRAPRAGSPPGI